MTSFHKRFILSGLLLLVAAISAATFLRQRNADPFQGAAVTDPPFTPLTYSIHAFLWWDGGEAGMNLDWVRMMRFTHVKQTVAWRDIQFEAGGTFDFSRVGAILDEIEARDLEMVARLGGTPDWAMRPAADPNAHDTPPEDVTLFGAYCGALAERFVGRIRAYQIWNEPNLAREWGGFAPNATDYTALLAACSAAIRAADPDAILISAGLSPTGNDDVSARRDDLYLQDMYDQGFQNHIDVVGAHAAGYDAPEVGPDDAVAKGGHRWMSFRRVEDLRKIMIENGDAARQMALLEVGWTTNQVHESYAWYAVTDAEQAEYLRGAYAYAAAHWRPWVGLMSAIFLADPSWTEADEEYWFAITEPQEDRGFRFMAARPAFDALLRMEKVCGDIVLSAYPPEQDETPISPENSCR